MAAMESMSDTTSPAFSDVELASALGALLDGAEIALSVKVIDGGIHVRVNDAFAALIGRPKDDILGRGDADLWPPTLRGVLRSADNEALTRRGASAADLKLDLDGKPREWRLVRLPLTIGAAAPTHLVTLWLDRTDERRRAAQLQAALAQLEKQQQDNEELRRQMRGGTLRDSATGLSTDVHFDDQLRREVDLSQREHREFALVAIAIDPPNETERVHGAPARTRVAEALGRLLRSNTRAMDASCHFEGDRFGVLLSGVGPATAHSRMEQLRRQCATQIVVYQGQDLGFTVSMGVASFPHTANSREELIQACDAALAQARQRGGNQVTLASIRFEPS
jgi:diguanylate cyclase (GGDEF)-like protein